MANLKKAVAVVSLAASAILSPGVFQLDGFVDSSAAFAKNHDSKGMSEEQMHGKTYVVAKLEINAPPEKVFQILSDYDHANKVFPQIKQCKVVADKGATKMVKHEIAPAGVPGTYEYLLEIKEAAPHAMEWHRVSGDFKQVDGFWKLEPTENGRGTNVTYASYIDGGLFIPQMLIRRQSKIDMAGALSSLKAAAESGSSLQIAGRPGGHHVQ